jgi:hypothetical protein
VYSLGRLLEWLLTGDVSQDLGTRSIPRGGILADDVCDLLDRVLAKATAAIPENRYSSARELEAAVPDLWLSVKPRSSPQTTTDDEDASTIMRAALDLARRNDRIGWRELGNRVRRQYPLELRAWREVYEKPAAIPDVNALVAAVSDLTGRTLGRLVFSLAGVMSEQDGLNDQRRVVSDLLSVDDWNRAGRTVLVEAPRGMVYLFQYLHGALCCELGHFDWAVRLAQTTVPRSSGKVEPLWRQSDLTTWPDFLNHDATVGWRLLRSLPAKFDVLSQFFALKADFEVALASYSMLLSLLDLAVTSTKVPKVPAPDNVDMEVLPMFALMPFEVIQTSAGRVFGSRAVVEHVATVSNAKAAEMRVVWPAWQKAIYKVAASVQRNMIFRDDLPLGDLA